jgi:hypothetical protein
LRTVVNLEVKKLAGKGKRSRASYEVRQDPDTGLPLVFGLDTIPGFDADAGEQGPYDLRQDAGHRIGRIVSERMPRQRSER